MTELQVTVAILVPEMVVLLWFYARAIGWQPRWRWESEFRMQDLDRRIDRLEFRLGLLEARLRDRTASR